MAKVLIFRVGKSHATISEMSDVYSFGVFLLELVTGQQALHNIAALGSNESLIQWVRICQLFVCSPLSPLMTLWFQFHGRKVKKNYIK